MPDESSIGYHSFPMTNWSLIGRAGQANDAHREALNELLRRYWPALKTHLLIKQRIDSNDADDLVQSFIENKILERDLVGVADCQRGRFRTLLATALDNYVATQFEQRAARKRVHERAASLDDDKLQHAAVHQELPDQSFDVAWAREVLNQTLSRMEDECQQSSRPDVWQVFDLRIRTPILDGVEPLGYAEIVQRFSFQSPSQASNVLITAKRMFARLMRDVISEYVMSDEELNAELSELELILAKSGAALQ